MNLRSLLNAADKGTQFPPHAGYLGTKAQREEALNAGLSEYLFELENPKRRSAAEEVHGRVTAEGSKLAEAVGSQDREGE